MAEQYVARDKETGFEVAVTGDFPEHPDDRMRIARTTTLFTRLMSTLLQRDESQRRVGFRAIETQLELADALIRGDHGEVQRLVRETLSSMGVSEDQLRELAQRLAEAGGLDPRVAQELSRAFGLEPSLEPPEEGDESKPTLEELQQELEQLEELQRRASGLKKRMDADADADQPGELDPQIMEQLEQLLADADLGADGSEQDAVDDVGGNPEPPSSEGEPSDDESEPPLEGSTA